jgi:glucose/arabinose dehydrogenase
MIPRFSGMPSSRLALVFFMCFLVVVARAQDGDVAAGKSYYAQSCAICHSDTLGPNNAEVQRQGPSLVGVVGRKAAAATSFSYTDALKTSGLTWDVTTLDRFLTNPSQTVPGTTMPVAIDNSSDRKNVIAYLASLHMPSAPPSPSTTPGAAPPTGGGTSAGDWHSAVPGRSYHIKVEDLPPPFATISAGNGPKTVAQPADSQLAVPAGFTVKLYASGFHNCRYIRVAPNGDIFVAETGANRIHVLRSKDGDESPRQNLVFAEGLDHPFGLAFYPAGDDPKWLYVANNNSVVRIPYHSGDLAASGAPEVIVPKLTESHGGHSTRDIAFSPDGKRLFISVGSGSNIADRMSVKSADDAHAWEAQHGLGAAWDNEENRADILVTDAEGKAPLHTFATGIRNGVGLAVNPDTGDLWTSVNERDGLGDDLVPDYITRVKEGAFYGWPWYWLGDHEDPRRPGERPDLAGKVTVPDVLVQAHSASLEMTFYNAKDGKAAFPAEYSGDAFAAFHGSWNRTTRTGYKVIRVRLNHGVPTGEYEDFLTGFVVDDRNVWGRPVGVAVAHDGALLVSEDGNNTIWRIAPTPK